MSSKSLYVLRPTSCWGDTYGTRSLSHTRRMKCLHEVFQYPFKDHAEAFSYRKADSQGDPRHSECCIVSYVYKGSVDYNQEAEQELIQTLKELEFGYHKAPVIYRNLPAYRIIVYDTDVEIDGVLELLK